MERNDEERRINRLAVLLMPNAYKRFKPIEWDKRYDPSSASDTHHDIDTRSGPRDHGIQVCTGLTFFQSKKGVLFRQMEGCVL